MADEYKSMEEIDRAFKKRLAEAEEADVPTVRAELAEAKMNLMAAQLQANTLAAAKRDAIAEFPLAKDFEDMVTGDTPEAIKASAQKIHERLKPLAEAAAPAQERQAAQQAYGAPSGGSGGNAPIAGQRVAGQSTYASEDDIKFVEMVRAKMANAQAMEKPVSDFISPAEAVRYERIRGGASLRGALEVQNVLNRQTQQQ